MKGKTLICMVGLPRAGKSTHVKQLREMGVPIVNGDSIRLAMHGERYIKLAETMIHAVSEIMVRALFIAGHDKVCVDETCVRRAHRDKWRHGDWDTVFWHIDTSKEVCLERAAKTEDSHIVPVIERMANQFDPLGDDEPRFTLEP